MRLSPGSCAVLLAFLVRSCFANICDVCDCQPARNAVFSITCDCESTKHLHLTSSMMLGVESANMMIIKNCQIVSVEKNSFSQLSKLETLGIQNCWRLYLATGAFSSLNSLLINNVHDISFGEMALMGARGIKNIIINSSNITELPRFALYDVEGMERFSISGVNIGRINRNAFNISAKTIAIENSKMNYTEAVGFTLRAQKVIIQKSEIRMMEPSSVEIETEFQTRLLDNSFGGFFQMNVSSPFVELTGNRFENLSPSVFTRVQMPRLMNNLIFNSDYKKLFQRFSHKDFHDNQFVCRCGMGLLSSTRNSDNYEILKNNYCMTNCSLSLFEFEVESIPTCMRDNKVDVAGFCNYERTYRKENRLATEMEASNFTTGKIQPRFLDLDGREPSACGKMSSQLSLLLGTFALLLKVKVC